MAAPWSSVLAHPLFHSETPILCGAIRWRRWRPFSSSSWWRPGGRVMLTHPLFSLPQKRVAPLPLVESLPGLTIWIVSRWRPCSYSSSSLLGPLPQKRVVRLLTRYLSVVESSASSPSPYRAFGQACLRILVREVMNEICVHSLYT